MKRITILFLSALAICALTSCVPSLHPLFTKEDVIFKPELVGKWSSADSSDSWKFTKAGSNRYTLVYTDDDGKAGQFKATLFKLGDQQFLDLFPDDDTFDKADAPTLYTWHLQPMHTRAKVDSIGPALEMGFLSPKWMENKLKENPDAIRHETVNDRIVLTAPTKDLQAFVTNNVHSGEMFGKPMDLLRE